MIRGLILSVLLVGAGADWRALAESKGKVLRGATNQTGRRLAANPCAQCPVCVQVPNPSQGGISDAICAPCANNGQTWWPCNTDPAQCVCATGPSPTPFPSTTTLPTPAPVMPTAAPSPTPPSAPETPAPTMSTTPPPGPSACSGCQGCIFASNGQCYADIQDEATCVLWAGNTWCGGASPEPTTPAPSPTVAPTVPPPSPTPKPTPSPTLDTQPSPTPPAPPSPTPKPTTGSSVPTPPPSASPISSWFTKEDFAEFFPNINNGACSGKDFFTFEAFIEAAKSFPTFANSGNQATDKRELAAFLGQTSHETTGGWATAPGGPFAWGYCFKEEVGCESGGCTQYCDSSNAQYPCVAGQTYQGRGPMQLSWNYNYGFFSSDEAVFGDKNVLLSDPGMVASDPVLAYKAGLWFWMTPQAPKPSCHAVMTGEWTPSSQDLALGRTPGYGMTTNIINGGLECNQPTNAKVEDRVGFYRRYSGILSLSFDEDDEASMYCNNMVSYR